MISRIPAIPRGGGGGGGGGGFFKNQEGKKTP